MFALPPRDADLDHISVLVQVEQALDHDVTMSVRRNDLEGEVQHVHLLKRGRLLAHHSGDPAQLC